MTSKMEGYMAKKAQEKTAEIIPVTVDTMDVKSLIHVIRGKQVMLDSDLAMLYQVETKVFNQSVTRNIERFPENFRFQLTKEEYDVLRSQNATSNGRGGRRYLPYVFTEQGIAMLSGVLRSDVAVQVSIRIMNTFWNLNFAFDKAQNKAQKSRMTDREHILLLLKENPLLTQMELSEMMEKSRRAVQMLMKELLDEGAIERVGSKKKGSWIVKQK